MIHVKEYIRQPKRMAVSLLQHYGSWIPDKPYIQWMYRLKMGKKLNLKNPTTFSEKLQWLKLYNRKPEYTTMVDKYAVKEYVAKIVGGKYVIPTLGVWDRPEDIDWDLLPNQFVLKTTHGGGNSGVVICKDKASLDKEEVNKKLNCSLKQDIYKVLREWPYKNVPRRIIAEQFIEPDKETNDLPDYKFFCFNGVPKFCQVISGRNTKECIDFFDKEWNHQPFHEPKYLPFSDIMPQCPNQYIKMWQLAELLAEGKPFSRIDFFNVGDKVYFGEITFFPTSGLGGFDPVEWDSIFGGWIKLPSKM